MKTALLLLSLLSVISLPAYDRNKSADELENISLNKPGETAKRTYSVIKGAPYAVSALISGSHSDIAWIEVKLFKDKKQCDFFRSLRNTKKTERIEIVFNAGIADRAEVSCILLQDAMPDSKAKFEQYRFVRCDNTTISPWQQKASYNCRRVVAENGDIIIYPNGNRATAYIQNNLSTVMPDTKMRFSADIKADAPNTVMLQVNCNSGKNKSQSFRSQWNRTKEETLSVDFNTDKFRSISFTIRCNNTKKHKQRPVTVSNIKLTVIPQK